MASSTIYQVPQSGFTMPNHMQIGINNMGAVQEEVSKIFRFLLVVFLTLLFNKIM